MIKIQEIELEQSSYLMNQIETNILDSGVIVRNISKPFIDRINSAIDFQAINKSNFSESIIFEINEVVWFIGADDVPYWIPKEELNSLLEVIKSNPISVIAEYKSGSLLDIENKLVNTYSVSFQGIYN